MTFLSPLTLFGLLLVALPVLIHLLARRRARRLDFPSLEFLRETPSFKLYPRRVRQPLLLILRASALVLLVMGLARPFFNAGAGKPAPLRFILMDASLSMRARGRAEAAREQARAIVDKLSAGERAAVISFSSGARLLVEETAERDRLLRAIDGYNPAGGATDYNAALALASARAGREPGAEVEVDVVSDFQQAGLEGEFVNSAGLKVVTYAVGSEVERNAFLVDESLRRREGGASELSVSELVAGADGRSGARRSWPIDEAAGARDGLEWRTESNGQLTGRVRALHPDDFDADDERFFAFSRPREPRVLLVESGTGADLYLGAALEAAGGGENSVNVERRSALPGRASELQPYSLIVLTLRGAAREDELRALAEYAAAGGSVWLCLARDLDTVSWNRLAASEAGRALPFESVARADVDGLSFGAADRGARSLRAMDDRALASLGAVRVRAGYAVEPRNSAEALIRWTDGRTALVYGRVDKGSVLLLATSPETGSGDLGASPAFPTLAASVLAAAMEPYEPPSISIGDAVRLGTGPEAEVRITDPSGRVSIARAGELMQRPADHFGEPGVYGLEFEGRQKFLAFNAPVAESERGLAGEDAVKRFFAAGEQRAASATVAADSVLDTYERRGSLWRYLLAAAFLLLIAELFVALRQRKDVGAIE